MELLSEKEIKSVIKNYGHTHYSKWYLEEFEDKLIGYLGDHLKLIIEIEESGRIEKKRCFVKCMPRNDKWKSEYLQELKFFKKEFVMLSSLFRQFQNLEGSQKWRPKLLYIREDLFIFEDVGHLGYTMPNFWETMTFDELKASIYVLARFHAASYILEENKSKEMGRPYRIWEDYSEYLQEPVQGQRWRDVGRNAIIDFLKENSKYKDDKSVIKKADAIIPLVFDKALYLMKPNHAHRNVVVHRDLWSNNVLIKRESQTELHAVIVDFQTVLYANPMLDLTSLIYFNTTKKDRDEKMGDYIDLYWTCLSSVLQSSGLNIADIFKESEVMKSFRESIAFGLSQAALIVPIATMSSEKKTEIFGDPEKSINANVVSRGEIFLEFAKENETYRNRVRDLFDEIVERYVIADELACA